MPLGNILTSDRLLFALINDRHLTDLCAKMVVSIFIQGKLTLSSARIAQMLAMFFLQEFHVIISILDFVYQNCLFLGTKYQILQDLSPGIYLVKQVALLHDLHLTGKA